VVPVTWLKREEHGRVYFHRWRSARWLPSVTRNVENRELRGFSLPHDPLDPHECPGREVKARTPPNAAANFSEGFVSRANRHVRHAAYLLGLPNLLLGRYALPPGSSRG
jgi:hypothetical protein